MVVAEPVERGDRLCRVLLPAAIVDVFNKASDDKRCSLPVVVDKREPFALPGDLVLGEEDPGNVAEGFEELLQVRLLGVLREVADPDGRRVLPPPVRHGVALHPHHPIGFG